MKLDLLRRSGAAEVKRGKKNKMRRLITILALTAIASIIITTGCISKEVQGAKIAGDIGYSVGYISENQTDIQKISWTVSITNTGVKTAKGVTAYVILHHEIVSRLNSPYMSSLMLDDLQPGIWTGFKGNATFNSTGLSKQDIAAWEPLVKIKVTWTEEGKVNEKLLPDEVSK